MLPWLVVVFLIHGLRAVFTTKDTDVPEISPKPFGLLGCGQFLTRISSLNRKDDRAQFLVK